MATGWTTRMKTITTIDEAKAIKPGAYPVKGAVGVIFRKTADIPASGPSINGSLSRGGRPWISLGVLKPLCEALRGVSPSRGRCLRLRRGSDTHSRQGAPGRTTRHKAPVTFRQSTATYPRGYTPTLKGPYADKQLVQPDRATRLSSPRQIF